MRETGFKGKAHFRLGPYLGALDGHAIAANEQWHAEGKLALQHEALRLQGQILYRDQGEEGPSALVQGAFAADALSHLWPGFDLRLQGQAPFEASLKELADGLQLEGQLTLKALGLRLEEPSLAIDDLSGKVGLEYAEGWRCWSFDRLSFEKLRLGSLQCGAGDVSLSYAHALGDLRLNLRTKLYGGGIDLLYARGREEETLTIQLEGVQAEQLIALWAGFQGQVKGHLSGLARLRKVGESWVPERVAIALDEQGRIRYEDEAWLTDSIAPGHPDYEGRKLAERVLEDFEVSQLSLSLEQDEAGYNRITAAISGASTNAIEFHSLPVGRVQIASLRINFNDPGGILEPLIRALSEGGGSLSLDGF